MIFAIALAVATIGIFSPQKPPEAKHQPVSASQPSIAADKDRGESTVTAIVKQDNAAQHDAEKENDDENIQIPKKLARFTLYLVAVGVVQALILACTIRAINKQRKTNQNIERAWIMADLGVPLDADILHSVNQKDQATTSIQPSVKLECANKGRSPGWITEIYGRFVVVREGELPKQPIIAVGDLISNETEPMAPGDSPLSIEWQNVADGRHVILTTHAIFYGVVKYRDIFGNKRETWFGYELMGHRNGRRLKRLAHLSEYNKHT